MTISLTPETQRLLEEQMKRGGYSSADDAVRAALQTLESVRAADYDDDLDDQTRASLDRAEEQYERGETIPLDEAFEQARRKHFGH